MENKKAQIGMNKNTIVLLGVIILILLFAFGGNTASVVSGGSKQFRENKTLDIEGAKVYGETSYFGSIKGGQSIYSDADNKNVVVSVCGDNDGVISVYSDLSKSNNGFKAGISASSYNYGCNGHDLSGYIQFTQAGKLTAKCKTSPSAAVGNGAVTATCYVGNFMLETQTDADYLNKKEEKNIEIEVKAGDKINYGLEVSLHSAKSMSSSATLDVEFTPNETTEEIDTSSETYESITQSSTEELSFLDKVAVFISSFLDKIFGVFN